MAGKKPVKIATKKREPLGPSDVCLCMHTALRKVCDSKITSSVYNMVHLVAIKPEKYDPWRFFGQLVVVRLGANAPPAFAVRGAHAALEDEFVDVLIEAKGAGVEIPREALTWMYALSCAMHCFSARDWEGMASYLGEED
jgi:hypothetical protein